MINVASAVDDRHDYLICACVDSPGFRGVDIGVVYRAAPHARVTILAVLIVKSPQSAEMGVVWDYGGTHLGLVFVTNVVPLGV